jgi:hypothetical protein
VAFSDPRMWMIESSSHGSKVPRGSKPTDLTLKTFEIRPQSLKKCYGLGEASRERWLDCELAKFPNIQIWGFVSREG